MWILAHFGVLGLKAILTDEKLLKDGTYTKDEPESATRDIAKGLSGIVECAPVMNSVQFEKPEKGKDLIVLNVGNNVLREKQTL